MRSASEVFAESFLNRNGYGEYQTYISETIKSLKSEDNRLEEHAGVVLGNRDEITSLEVPWWIVGLRYREISESRKTSQVREA